MFAVSKMAILTKVKLLVLLIILHKLLLLKLLSLLLN